MNEVLRYLIRFLLGEEISEVVAEAIGYTTDRHQFGRYSLVIYPSGFFDESVYGTARSLPTLPLSSIEGVPWSGREIPVCGMPICWPVPIF